MAELRKSERFSAELSIQVAFDDQHYAGRTVNLSLGGALVRLDGGVTLRVGSRVRVRLALPTLAAPLEADAEIRWNDDDGACGLQFASGFRARETWALGQWLDRLRREQGAT